MVLSSGLFYARYEHPLPFYSFLDQPRPNRMESLLRYLIYCLIQARQISTSTFSLLHVSKQLIFKNFLIRHKYGDCFRKVYLTLYLSSVQVISSQYLQWSISLLRQARGFLSDLHLVVPACAKCNQLRALLYTMRLIHRLFCTYRSAKRDLTKRLATMSDAASSPWVYVTKAVTRA